MKSLPEESKMYSGIEKIKNLHKHQKQTLNNQLHDLVFKNDMVL